MDVARGFAGHAAKWHNALILALGMQEGLVRDTAVTALLELYADQDNVEPMHELTARFAPRFAQLIHDVDEGVAVKGVGNTHSSIQASNSIMYKPIYSSCYCFAAAAPGGISTCMLHITLPHLSMIP